MEQICKMCGGRLKIDAVRQIATCPYCDTVFPLSQKIEKTRQHWEDWVQGDAYRNALQTAWQKNAAEQQRLQRKSDSFWKRLERLLRLVCMGAIFLFAATLSAWLKMSVKTIGEDPSWLGSMVIGWVFCLILLLIPSGILWLLWRWKERFGKAQRAKTAAEFYQRELQLWDTVHSLENFRNGAIEEESYRRGSQARCGAFEQSQMKAKDTRWKRYASFGIPLLLGALLGFCLNITMR